MADLKQLMRERDERLSDASYVAPNELRVKNRSNASVNPSGDVSMNYLEAKAALAQAPKVQIQDQSLTKPNSYTRAMLESQRDQDVMKQEIATQLGLNMHQGNPILSDDHEQELNASIDAKNPDERQKMWLKLMTDKGDI